MVPADSRRIPRAPRYSGAAWRAGLHFAYGAVTRYGHAFLRVPLCITFLTAGGPTTPGVAIDNPGLGWCAFARHYLRNRFYFLFLRVLRCFSSPGSPLATPGVGIAPDGFPHSDIRGSQGICPSPRLFAAYHVLHRLREPQASPVRPCSLSLFLSAAPYICPLRGGRRSRPFACIIRLARFFRFSQSNRFDFLVLRSHHVNDLFNSRSPRQT